MNWIDEHAWLNISNPEGLDLLLGRDKGHTTLTTIKGDLEGIQVGVLKGTIRVEEGSITTTMEGVGAEGTVGAWAQEVPLLGA